MKERFISPRKMSHIRCLALLIMLILIYIMENYIPIFIRTSFLFTYVCKPLSWLLIIITFLKYPRVKNSGKIRIRNTLIWVTALTAIVYISIMIISGILGGFAKSPYDHSLCGIIYSIISVFPALIGREMVRSYVINSNKNKNIYFMLGVMAVFMTFIEIPISSIDNLKTKLDIITYIGETVIPKLSINIYASYLVYLGGAYLSIIYIGVLQAFLWFFPIVPNPPWNIKILIDILLPAFSMMFMQYFYSCKIKDKKNKHVKKDNPMSWSTATVIAILVIWFAVGVFPIQPFVIATGSMEPLIYPGDMVLVKRMDAKNIKVGDVIQYRKENIYIFHRIIDTVEEDGELKYKTKGDNNSVPDKNLVKSNDIRGKVIYTIPKIGWPTLFLRSSKGVDKKEVEF